MMKVFALLLTVGIFLTACGSSNDKSGSGGSSSEGTDHGGLTTVRYAVMTSTISHWAAVVGQETGIWEKYGLNVEATEFAAGINTIDAITNGEADIGYIVDFGAMNRFGNISGETDLRLFASIAISSGVGFYVNPDTVSKVEDLKGKGVMYLAGTVSEYWISKLLESGGLTTEDVTLMPLDSTADSLAVATKGDADGIWVNGMAAAKLEEIGWKPLVTTDDLNLNSIQLDIASEKYLSENEETVETFLQAMDEVQAYISENTDEVADIIYDKTSLDQSTFKKEISAMTMSQGVDKDILNSLKEINTWAIENNFYENEFEIEDYFNLTALKATFPDKVEMD